MDTRFVIQSHCAYMKVHYEFWMLVCFIFQNYYTQPLFTIFRGTTQSKFQYQKLYKMFGVVPLTSYYFRISYSSRYVVVMG
jgi:hypothetical protein